MKVCIVVGIRPQYIKMAPLMKELEKDKEIEQIIINTGQHYDYKMAQQFFEDLKIPDAGYNLEVGSGTQAEQTAKMLVGIERVLNKEKPDVVLVVGDANSTLAGALASVKLHIPAGHIEAGLRSGNWQMPEETNRVLADHCSKFLFVPTKNAQETLQSENPMGKIFFTGDITVDVMRKSLERAEKSSIMTKLKLTNDFILLTLHRPENVDNPERLEDVLRPLSKLENVVFPVHPRTEKMIRQFGLDSLVEKFELTEPLGYFEFLMLLKNTSLVITDSGGVQKEAFLLKTPCVTFRNETEWPETVEAGANMLATPENIGYCIDLMKNKKIAYKENPFGDGNVPQRIIQILKEWMKL